MLVKVIENKENGTNGKFTRMAKTVTATNILNFINLADGVRLEKKKRTTQKSV